MSIIPSHDDPLMTVDDIAGIFAVKAYTVREWIKSGKLTAIKLPTGGWRIQHSAMVEFANRKYGDEK